MSQAHGMSQQGSLHSESHAVIISCELGLQLFEDLNGLHVPDGSIIWMMVDVACQLGVQLRLSTGAINMASPGSLRVVTAHFTQRQIPTERGTSRTAFSHLASKAMQQISASAYWW